MYTWSAFFSFKGNLFMRKWRLYMLSRFFLGGNSSKVSYSSIAFSNVFAKKQKEENLTDSKRILFLQRYFISRSANLRLYVSPRKKDGRNSFEIQNGVKIYQKWQDKMSFTDTYTFIYRYTAMYVFCVLRGCVFLCVEAPDIKEEYWTVVFVLITVEWL